ncbi:hypothetical protein PHYC_02547 [Phycisphaerales bacterium]|nr:hypothetical protein PHYC_02547 [Phycisphaerales bacterium]
MVGGCLKAALGHLAAGRAEKAVEAIAAAAIADIQQHQQTFLAGAPEAAFLGDLYQEAFKLAGVRGTRPRTRPAAPLSPRRVVYVLSSVVEGQAASANVLRFLTLHNRAEFDPVIVVVEENTRREPPLTFLAQPQAPSERIGAVTIARMRAAAPVHVVPPLGTFVDGVELAAELVRSLAPDLAVFVASPACPIQAGMAFARVAPSQAVMNIGVPLVLRGVDAVIFNNPARERDDAGFLATRGVAVHGVETSGGDARSGVFSIPRSRESLGLPGQARVLASISNAIARRMLAGTFARDLAAFLASRPDIWWMGVGAISKEDISRVRAEFERAGGGVTERCVFSGPAEDPREHIKCADVFLNEYPEGGGNSVIEAMGCGVPVVAMRAGDRHAESIGATLVGLDAIPAPDAARYWALVDHWLADESARGAAAARQQERALARFDYPVVCRQYELAYRALMRSGAANAVSAPVPS